MSLRVSISTAGLSSKLAAWKAAAEGGLKSGAATAAQLFEDEARVLVPVKTGNLQGHIHTETVEDTPQVQTLAVSPTVDAGNEYGFDPPYARRIEFGFMDVDSLGRHYHQAAQPYMRPAYDNKQEEAAQAIKDSVTGSLAEVA